MKLRTTPLYGLHQELGARLVPFAGYEMPVQFPSGVLSEHRHTRESVGLFDVSHMGQFLLEGPGITDTLEALLPVDLQSLGESRMTYALLTNENGGVRDDVMITRLAEETFFMVVNAACKDEDRAWIDAKLSPEQTLTEWRDRGLLAVQGPQARAVLGSLIPELATLPFMHTLTCEFEGIEIFVSCSGYTGEDGYELSIAPEHTEIVARALLKQEQIQSIGLGARDSLRLEVGLCLYGHELSATISPIEARLLWSIHAARRPGGARAGGYPGAEIIGRQIEEGVPRVRVGLVADGKRPLREQQELFSLEGRSVGRISSGAHSPALDAPVAMGFIEKEQAVVGNRLQVSIRDKLYPVSVQRLPLVPQRYFRG
ncbi:MAG: glycine cleavage system aminomethyltransferase GcvT [Pseudomonadota bacterium]